MSDVAPGIALAMSVALEGVESDIGRVIRLLAEPHHREECANAAAQLLTRAKQRVQAVRFNLNEKGAPALSSI